MFYDPMIAKLITYGETREAAIDRMCQALDEYYIQGVQHNISFLNALMVHPRFREGRLSTNFIAEEYPDGFNAAHVPQEDPAKSIVVAACVHRGFTDRAAQLSGQMPGHERVVDDDWVVVVGGGEHHINIVPTADGYRAQLEGTNYDVVTDWVMGQPLFKAVLNGESICFQVARQRIWYHLMHRGAKTDAVVMTPLAAALHAKMPEKVPPDLSKFLLSPMPGLLVKMSVKEGDEVKVGQEVAVIEAMKMENVLRAEQDAVVARVASVVGDSLMVDQVLVEFE
jgi:propionyl-CoA carboxylase alpha chain